jgi:hypothetical protein
MPTLVSVEGQESERLAKIMAKLNLSQALSEQEVKFLVKVIEQHYTKLDKVLQDEIKQAAQAESKMAFLARLNNIIEDPLTLGFGHSPRHIIPRMVWYGEESGDRKGRHNI